MKTLLHALSAIFLLGILLTLTIRRLNQVENLLKTNVVIPVEDLVKISEIFYTKGQDDFYRPKLSHHQVDSTVRRMVQYDSLRLKK